MLWYVLIIAPKHHSGGPSWFFLTIVGIIGALTVLQIYFLISIFRLKRGRAKLMKGISWGNSTKWTPLQRELVDRLYDAVPYRYKYSYDYGYGYDNISPVEKADVIASYNDHRHDGSSSYEWYERALVGVRTRSEKISPPPV